MEQKSTPKQELEVSGRSSEKLFPLVAVRSFLPMRGTLCMSCEKIHCFIVVEIGLAKLTSNRLDCTERSIVKHVCTATVSAGQTSEEVSKKYAIDSISAAMRRGKLCWFWPY